MKKIAELAERAQNLLNLVLHSSADGQKDAVDAVYEVFVGILAIEYRLMDPYIPSFFVSIYNII